MTFSRLAGIVMTGLILGSADSYAQQANYSDDEIMKLEEKTQIMDSVSNYMIGALALGLVGVLYFRKKDDND